MTGRVDAIVLAGGRGTRMGGVDKPSLTVGGATMLETALAAAAECDRRVVVGPARTDLGTGVRQACEDPPGAGPVAAASAGLRALEDPADIIVLLAADMPLLRVDTVRDLVRRTVHSGRDVVCAVDADGRAQYLVSAWRRDALTARLARLGDPSNLPMKALVGDDPLLVALDGIADCDTDDDVRRVAAHLDGAAMTLDAARNTLRTKLTPIAPHRLPPDAALHAVLAEPMHAADAVPRFDTSAMDGYAVHDPGPWTVRDDVGAAGGARPSALTPGVAVRIATGARLPDGTTGVIRDEHAQLAAATLRRTPGVPVRDDIRRRGEDWQIGDTLAPAGALVGPVLLSLAAGTGVAAVTVRGPVRARVLLSGDEIASGAPGPDQTRDALGPALQEFLARCGIRGTDTCSLADTTTGFDAALTDHRRGGDADLLIVVGATGGGPADQLRGALDRAHARTLVPRLRMRPGGSTVVAELPSGRVVLGLPGNPFAAVCVLLTLVPAIVDGLTDRTARPRPNTGRLANAGSVCGPVTRVLPALALSDGTWVADPTVRTAHLGGLLGRDALVVVPPHARDDALVELIPGI